MGLDLLIALGLAISGYSVLQPVPGTYQVVAVNQGLIRVDTRKGTAEFCQPQATEDGAVVLACKPLPEAK